MMRRRIFFLLVAGLLLAGTGAASDEETRRLVEDEGFFAFPVQRNGEPMPLRQLQEEGSGNIVRVDFTDPGQLRIQVQGQFQQQDQIGVNLDIDHDGQGDYWIFVDPAQRQRALLTDAYFVPLGRVPFGREEESMIVLPMGEIAGEYRLEDHSGEFDPTLIIATFNRGISTLEMLPLWLGEDRPQRSERPQSLEPIPYQLGEPIEIVQVNGPQGDSPAYGFLLESQQSQGQQQMLKDKYCPPKNPLPWLYFDAESTTFPRRVPGPDYYFVRNTQVHAARDFAIRIELWCMSDSAFGKRIQDSTGRYGWIGKCPYVGGRNFQQKVDEDGDGVPDRIKRTILDGAPDAQGDLAFTVFEYEVRTGRHTTTKSVYVDWVNSGPINPKVKVGPITRTGPYPKFADLP